MARVKKRIFAGSVCDQIVYNVSDRAAQPKQAQPQVRFKTEEERAEHRRLIARRHHARMFNANYGPTSLYSTLTFDVQHEVHDFDEARRLRKNLYRQLSRKYPEARIHIYMGRGKSTHRIHFHMVSDGLPEDFIRSKWDKGDVVRIDHLREHNHYNGVDLGQDYTGLANYLFDHWTEEQGGHHYLYSRRTVQLPEEETPTEAKVDYTPGRPPKAPKGYVYISCTYNRYGYMCFHYIKPPQPKRRKARE